MPSSREHYRTPARANKEGKPTPGRKEELQNRLLELLSVGRLVITPQWNHPAGDWVTSVGAADIDDDGDIEIVAGSRDGYVRVLTRQGAERWKKSAGQGRWITSIAIIPSSGSSKSSPRIIAGTRDGKLYAFDQQGNQLADWSYQTAQGQVIHQIYVHHAHPDEIIVGAEDRQICLLDSYTGTCRWRFGIRGRVLCVYVADIDGDGDQEILASATDRQVYILNRQGDLKGTIKLAYKSCVLAATEWAEDDTKDQQASIFASYNGKDLRGWTTHRRHAHNPGGETNGPLAFRAYWPSHAHGNQQVAVTFQRRPQAIHIADINNDGQPEILVGSTDHFLYILDHLGQLLWKHDCKQNIYSICTCDYDDDGITEIILGLGDNNVRTLKIELAPYYELSLQHTRDPKQQQRSFSLYQQIQDITQKLHHLGARNLPIPNEALTDIASNLGLLQEERHNDKKREFYLAQYKYEMREYKDALAILLRLREQWVQQYWDQPLKHLGHIRDLELADVRGNPINEIIVGTDEGRLIAIDINKEQEELWQPRPRLDSSVVTLQCGNPQQEGYEVTIAILEDGSIQLLDNNGHLSPLPDHVLQAGDHVSSLYTTTEYVAGSHRLREIIVGLENCKIYVYRALFAERLAIIPTEHSIRMLYACDVTGNGQTDILAGAANYAVYLYVQDEHDPTSYRELWHYQTKDRIRALHATDIDKDGNVEILIGSEDRNLYVLNHLGQLKWRYFMPDSVLSVDAYDIDNDEHHRCDVLAGVADGFVYIFNAEGDLRKKIPAHDRVRVVRAKDLHSLYYSSYADGFVEIVVATDDRLQLLQVLPFHEIDEMIERCWRYILNNADYHEILHTYADHHMEDDQYIRAFAVARLAGQRDHTAEDFAVLQKAATEDPSLIVLEALTRSVVNLFHAVHAEPEVLRQARKLLHRLSLKPYLETRIAIVRMLHKLVEIDPDLSFDYLEGFLSNVDLWLRHMVVRQLYNLAEHYPERVFDLLTISVHDEHRWIRQETGRSLARYFDCHLDTLFADLHKLLGNGIDPVVTEQIAVSAEQPHLQHFFSALTDFLRAIKADPNSMLLEMPSHDSRQHTAEMDFTRQKKHNEAELDKFINALQSMMQTNPQAEDTLAIYQELQNLLQVKTIDDIEQFRRFTRSEEFQAFDHFRHIDNLIEELLQIVHDIKRYRKRQVFSDQAASLIEAIFHLRGIFYRYVEDRQHISSSQALSPEDALIYTTLQQWYTILRQELRFMRGTAELLIETTSDEIQREDTVDLFFRLRNVGRSAADNVRVQLAESKDFDIVSSPECHITEISSQHPATVSFTIKPFLDSFLVETDVTYTDAEHHNRPLKRRHHIDLKKAYRAFKAIPNPYHGGTPISSDGNMFYGREEDLCSLCEVLSSTASTANRVILLIGQRRSGKTSLIYQLETKLSPHVAVHIDLQTFAMSNNTADLFAKIAHAIYDTLRAKGFAAPDINEQDFHTNPTQSLNRYLELVTRQLSGLRLILLIDEFEVFNQLIQDQRLDANFLHYLRSLMQHRLGINFLLAGAPRILLNDLNNRSAFLNIAQHHHLSRLKYEEAEQLIVDPVSADLTYDPIALERMHNLTGDQPYLIHLLSEALIYNCNQHRKNYANTNDVNIALNTALERGQNFFGLMWGLTASPIERLLLSLMAQEDIDERQVKTFSLADLREAFDDLGILYKSEQVQAALLHLRQEELIEEDSDGHLFTIPAGLMRAWLRQYKAPERVVREEIVTLESAD